MSGKGKTAIVTGGAGFIGSHMVDVLVDNGYRVRVIDNLVGGREANIAHHASSPGFEFVQSDIREYQPGNKLFDGADIVIHFAGIGDIVPSIEKPMEYMSANVQGTVHMLECARHAGVKKFVYAASSSCYGLAAVPTREDHPISPEYPYALSKYQGEQAAFHWHKVYHLPVNSIRIFNAYGTRSRTSGAYGAVFGVFLKQKLAGKPFTVVGDGSQRRDFLFARDVAEAFRLAAETGMAGQVWNLGAGNPQSVNRLVELLGGEVTYIPKRPGEPDCTWADITKIQRDLGWKQQISFEDGVRRILDQIDYWRDAPLWDPASIAKATEVWFKSLSAGELGNMDEGSKKIVSHKIKTAEEIAAAIGKPPRAKKVIMCHGTFDVVHPGHIRHLLYAKSKGDILVASLTGDAHITKANFRPYVPQELRAFNLAALEVVDYVVIDKDPTPIGNLKIIQPDYFAKGYEYTSNGLHPKTAEEKAAVEAYGGEILFTPGDIVYSSSNIIEAEAPSIATEKLMALLEGENLSLQDLRTALTRFKGVKVHVVGDLIVDSYTHTVLIGGMTKTPTMSVRFQDKRDFVGGAGIVAKHLHAGGADVTYSTVVGDDALALFALKDLEAAGVKCEPIVDPTRPTTNKNAIVAGGYNLLKVDTLDNRSISEKITAELVQAISNVQADIVVFSDFRHGMFNRDTIPVLTRAIPKDVFRVADSQVASRWGNILEFQGFDLITPNEREARFALGDQDSVVRPLGLKLYRESGCKTLILKLGERGLLTFRSIPQKDEDVRAFVALDSFAERVVDAVGSGDALLAYATLALYTTRNNIIASALGSFSAAIECEHEGNIPVRPKDMLDKLDRFERLIHYR